MRYIRFITAYAIICIPIASINIEAQPSDFSNNFDTIGKMSSSDKELERILENIRETSIRINNNYLLHFTGDSRYANFTAKKYLLECSELDLDSIRQIIDSLRATSNEKVYYELVSALNKHSCKTLYKRYCNLDYPIIRGKQKVRYQKKYYDISKIDSLNKIKHSSRYGVKIDLKIGFQSCAEYENEIRKK